MTVTVTAEEIAQQAIETARALVNDSQVLGAFAEKGDTTPKHVANRMLDDLERELGEAVWSTKFVNDLPDSSFALVLPGGKKDEDGKTTPRNLRKLPYKAAGKVDLPHLRNALQRISQMKGVTAAQRASAQKKLDTAAKKHLKTQQKEGAPGGSMADLRSLLEQALDVAEDPGMGEVSGSLRDMATRVEDAFHAKFSPADRWDGPYRVRDVFAAHPDLGDSLVVDHRTDGKLYFIPYVEGENGLQFSPNNEWQEVMLAYTLVTPAPATTTEAALTFTESMAEATLAGEATPEDIEALKEAGVTVGTGRRAPVLVDFQVMKPGPGNKRDNHYYPASVLKRDIGLFEGAHIFVTNHKADERSEQTKVGRLRECPIRFIEGGAPVGRAIIYDPDQAEKTRNRADAGEIKTLECSIYGNGRAKPGEIGGVSYKVVEEITEGKYLELVSEGGAGGHAVGLAENDGGENMSEEQEVTQEAQTEETLESEQVEEVALAEGNEAGEEAGESEKLAEADITAALSEARLPDSVKVLLKLREYTDADELKAAVSEMVETFKEVTGSGKPTVKKGTTSAPTAKRSLAEVQSAQTAINQKWLGNTRRAKEEVTND